MLKIEDYKEEITKLYNAGNSAKKISTLLGFKYHQPVYNYFIKMKWPREHMPINRKYAVFENYFETIDTEEKAYILGFICADGHIASDRLVIAVAEKDVDILHKIKTAMGSEHPITRVYRNNPYNKSVRKTLVLNSLMIGSKLLVKHLFDKGITHDKTYTLNRSIMDYVPTQLARHFLRGYFDGDGNMFLGVEYSSGTKYSINVMGNEDFLLGSFQVYFPTTNKLYKDLRSKQAYSWKISSKEKVIAFLNYLYLDSSIYLERKYMSYKNNVAM